MRSISCCFLSLLLIVAAAGSAHATGIRVREWSADWTDAAIPRGDDFEDGAAPSPVSLNPYIVPVCGGAPFESGGKLVMNAPGDTCIGGVVPVVPTQSLAFSTVAPGEMEVRATFDFLLPGVFEDRGAAYGIQVSNTAGTDWVVFGIAQAPISPTDPAPSLVANMVEEGFPSPISLAGIELCADASDPTCTADALELVLTLTRTDIGGTDFLVPSCSLNVIGGPFDGIGADCTPSGLGDGRLSDAEAHSALLLNTVPEPGLAWLVAPALAAALRRRFVDRTPAPKLSGARSGRLHGRIS